CNVEIKLGQWIFPKVEIPKGQTAAEHLRSEAHKKLKTKYKKVTKELKDRLEFELEVIITKGYAPYFLIFQDLANWASENKVPINTRGSAAGSLVSYSLGITTVDPIKYLLPFERFLNPLRPKPPDIDMDIADNKRDEMIAYLVDKYGKDKVAQICTFGRMLAKGSVRDIARVLGYPYAVGDRISKVIPLGSQGFPMSIERALELSPELKGMYTSEEDTKKIIDLAKQVEGNARHASVHAAGVVISPGDLTDLSPLQLDTSAEKKLITQYEMHAAEDVGLVKLDILGIRNLSILGESVFLVEKTLGEKIDLSKIPLDDKKTFEMLSRGETMGAFQLSGSGMTKFIIDLKPERVEDLMAMVALYRPGPMANINDYIARKKGDQEITYLHPKMKNFLEKSFGILVYQDDLLFAALELAGYDWKSVDKLRNAIGKKIPSEMAKQHKIFVTGCIEHSQMTEEKAEGLWALFEPFQGYGFNKAHAASYGMVSYQTSYMKANYPVQYMCALLTAECNDKDKVSLAIHECKRIGIKVEPPDINQSGTDFTIIEDEGLANGYVIRFGLNAIKNVGKAAIEAIFEARNEGDFVSFADFLTRVDGRRVNKRVLESLIKVGALSKFGNRATLLSGFDEVRNRISKPKGSENQQGLFSQEEIKNSMKTPTGSLLVEIDEFADEEIESLERELLGLSLSAKPVDELIGSLASSATHKISGIEKDSLPAAVKIAIVVEDVRVVITKKSGQEMAFVKVKDDTGSLDLVVFPKIYKNTRALWADNTPFLISGKPDNRDGELSILVDEVQTEEDVKDGEQVAQIRIPKGTKTKQLQKLKAILLDNSGSQKVSLFFEENGDRKVNLRLRVNWNKTLERKISQALEV
ncbi:DNA polymerase III subunit alpha, partial [Patescibacteria group bacterium]|nr:DNA polymerase III subunit alpha [Patescibacteria group bacterium]